MKKVELEFGDNVLSLSVPEMTDVLTLPYCAPLRHPAASIRKSLLDPIGVPALSSLVEKKRKCKPECRAVIVVSDNTRPVPYKGESGIVEPVLDVLAESGIRHVEVIVANGMHQCLSENDLKEILPDRVFESGIRVTNHACSDKAGLCHIGSTSSGSDVWINRRYMEADIKILTGLVEPHFMAGVSGGRKSICPGLAGESVTHTFHGPGIMADVRTESLVMDGNPCHDEALEVALMAGADFIVNATIDRERQLTGIYAGDMVKAHAAATARVIETNAISISHKYDLVITHAGFVGINHYQSAKACVEAVKAVRPGGHLIVAANNTDKDPVGSDNYKRVLPMLAQHGADGLAAALMETRWDFVPDQWGVQMWARVVSKLRSSSDFVYCAPQLTGVMFGKHALPGIDGGEGVVGYEGREYAEKMVQGAIDRFLAERPDCQAAVLADGPYGVPVPVS